eukprot:g60575.t1
MFFFGAIVRPDPVAENRPDKTFANLLTSICIWLLCMMCSSTQWTIDQHLEALINSARNFWQKSYWCIVFKAQRMGPPHPEWEATPFGLALLVLALVLLLGSGLCILVGLWLLVRRRKHFPLHKRAIPVIVLVDLLVFVASWGSATVTIIDVWGTPSQQQYPCRFWTCQFALLVPLILAGYVIRAMRLLLSMKASRWVVDSRRKKQKLSDWGGLRGLVWRKRRLLNPRNLALLYLCFCLLFMLPVHLAHFLGPRPDFWWEAFPACQNQELNASNSCYLYALVAAIVFQVLAVAITRALWHFESDNFAIKHEFASTGAAVLLCLLTLAVVGFLPYTNLWWPLSVLINGTGCSVIAFESVVRPVYYSFKPRVGASSTSSFVSTADFKAFMRTESGYDFVLSFMQREFATELPIFFQEVDTLLESWPQEREWGQLSSQERAEVLGRLQALAQQYFGFPPDTDLNFPRELLAEARELIEQLGFFKGSGPELDKLGENVPEPKAFADHGKLPKLLQDLQHEVVMMMFSRASAMSRDAPSIPSTASIAEMASNPITPCDPKSPQRLSSREQLSPELDDSQREFGLSSRSRLHDQGRMCDPELERMSRSELERMCDPELERMCDPELERMCDPELEHMSGSELASVSEHADVANYLSEDECHFHVEPRLALVTFQISSKGSLDDI